MPRAIVGPGSRSKRSFSSDSIWRGANFSCCATSSVVSPRASRACFSSAPTPISEVTTPLAALLKIAPLQRLVFRRARIAPSQLVGVALLGDALAGLALDPQRQPQRFGAGIGQLVVSGNQLARLLDLALAVADLAEIDQRRGLVG